MRGRYESARDVMEDLCAAIGDPPPFEDATIRESYLQAAPLVGRASELRRLDLALTSARESKGDAFVVVGESGVGKSRLVDELRTRCAVSGAEVVRGQALREGNAPFQIFREPVRQLALRAGVADEDATLLKVVAPDLARILDRPISPPPPIDPAILHQQIIGAVLKLLTRSDRPIVLILEDLHWMQDDSAMLLARCAAASRGSRLLIVGTARDDEAGDLKARFPGMTPIAVDRLSRPEVSDLAGMMIGPEGREPSLAEYLFRQSEGNCFFLVETMRALADRAGRLDRVAEIELPQRLSTRGVASVVEARLGRVPVDASKILDLAAVLGRDFDADLLQHALPESDVERLLAQAGTIVEPSGRRWRFAHDKLREEILRRLRADQRRALHVLAALAIEAKGDRAAEAAALAHHWGQANHPQKEIEYAQVAGDQLLAAGAQAGALVQLRRVAELLPTIADLADRDRRELSLRLSLGTALLATRGHASSEMRAAFDRAAVLCRDVGDRAQLFHVLFGQSTSCLFRGELRTALELAEQCLVIAEAIDDADLKIQSEFAIGNAAYWMSDFPRADAKLARVLTLHDPNRTPVHLQRFGHDPRTTCLTFGAWTSVACGRYERAAAQADEALDRAQNMGHPFAMAIAIQIAAITHQQLRNVAPARRFAESLLDMPEAFPTYRVCGMFISGWCDLDSGRSGAGIEAMLQAWAMWRAIGAGLAHGYYAVMLAQAYAVGGRWAEGLAMIDDARAVAIGRGERAFESELLRVRGELLAGQGSLFEAELELRNARAVAIDRGALGFELTATTSLARLLDKAGKRGDARTVLEPIIDRFSSATGARHVEAALALSSSLS
jgi:tetratricopeptide (TPR) repeat protein